MYLSKRNNRIIWIVLSLYAIVSCFVAAQLGGDFDLYLDASRKLYLGDNIYVNTHEKGLNYFYSVFFALVFIPFSKFIFITELAWGLFSCFLLYRTFILVKSYFDLSAFSKKQYIIWCTLILFLSLQFINYNVGMIQITFLLLWAIFQSLEWIRNEKYILGGILLGLVINIKIMPLLLLPYLFWRGYFKAMTVTILTFIVLLYLPAIFIGYSYNQFLLSEWWNVINPGNKEHLFEAGIGSNSLVALIPVYLTDTVGELDLKRNFVNLNHKQVELITNLGRLFIFSLSLFFLKSRPFKKETNKLKLIWEISFFTLIIPLILPHQQKYSLILVIPMVSYLLYFFITSFAFQKNIGYYISFIVFVISMLFYTPFYGSDLLGSHLFDVTQHYRILAFATLFLIPVAIYCSPMRLEKIKTNSN